MGGGSQFVPGILLAFLCIFQTLGAAFSRGNSTGSGEEVFLHSLVLWCWNPTAFLPFLFLGVAFWIYNQKQQLLTLCLVCVACVYMFKYVLAHTHMSRRGGQRSISRDPSLSLFVFLWFIFWNRVSHGTWIAPTQWDHIASELQDPPVLTSSALALQVCTTTPGFFPPLVLLVQTQVLMPECQALCWLNHIPSP